MQIFADYFGGIDTWILPDDGGHQSRLIGNAFYSKNSLGDKILMPSHSRSGKCFLFPVMIHFAWAVIAKSK